MSTSRKTKNVEELMGCLEAQSPPVLPAGRGSVQFQQETVNLVQVVLKPCSARQTMRRLTRENKRRIAGSRGVGGEMGIIGRALDLMSTSVACKR